MVLIYDRSDGTVVSSFAGNMVFGDGMSEMVRRMFPANSEQLGFCDVPIDSLPHDCKVQVDRGVVTSVLGDGKSVYEIDPEELTSKLQDKLVEERNELLDKMPYRNDQALSDLFAKKIPLMRQTGRRIADSIEDNSYFLRDVTPVGWWGSFTDAGGYANMNREIVQRLHNYRFLPYISMYPTPVQVSQETISILKLYSRLRPKSHNHAYVYAFTPMSHERHPGRKIFFTMMETSTLHPEFVRCCNQYSDEIWVPSRANRQLFSSNGIVKPVRVIPLGIDELLYCDPSRALLPFPIEECVGIFGRDPKKGIANYKFLTVIQWNFRKGFDALIKSFVNAFSAKDDACLLIATQYDENVVGNDLRQFLPREDNLPQVVLYNHVIPITMMPSIYDSCNCYVHLSRGEGFSLTQIEAAARGLPVISCCHSGITEYLREDNGYPIYCGEKEPCLPKLAEISYFYQGQFLWRVGPRQVARAAEFMRHVYEHPQEASDRAAILQKEVGERFTWKKATERVAEALRS